MKHEAGRQAREGEEAHGMSRRCFLKSAASAMAVGATLGVEGLFRMTHAGGFAEYLKYDALGLADLVRRKEVKPEDLLEAAIARVEALNPKLNALVTKMYDIARQSIASGIPDGPFQGVPFLLKDLIAAYAGARLTNGARLLANYVPKYDSELVKRHKKAGLVCFGKTNTPEFGLSYTTESVLLGPAYNPWNLECSTGGSSGGAAAAVAARIVPIAHGSDGGGSIRVPASCCGVFGMKPSRGRTPTGPAYGDIWKGFSLENALSLSVRDSAALLDGRHVGPGDRGAVRDSSARAALLERGWSGPGEAPDRLHRPRPRRGPGPSRLRGRGEGGCKAL